MIKFKLDYKAYFKRLIFLGWFALAFCTVIKLAGGNYFTIWLEEGAFKDVCTCIDNHLWANYIASALYCATSLRFFVLAMAQRKSFKRWERVLWITTVLAGTAIKIWSYEFGYIFDIWQMVLFPVVLVCREPKKLINVFYGNVALIVFQIVSMFLKEAAAIVIYEYALIGMLYGVDVIIMLILYYAYANIFNLKKEVPANV